MQARSTNMFYELRVPVQALAMPLALDVLTSEPTLSGSHLFAFVALDFSWDVEEGKL